MRKTAWGIAVAALLLALVWRLGSEHMHRTQRKQSYPRPLKPIVDPSPTQPASPTQGHLRHSVTPTNVSHKPASGFWQQLFGIETVAQPKGVACAQTPLSLRPLLERRDWPTLRASLENALADPACATAWDSARPITGSISAWLSRVEHFKQARGYLSYQTEFFESLQNAVAVPEAVRLGHFRLERFLENQTGYQWWQARDLDSGAAIKVGIHAHQGQEGQILRIPVMPDPGSAWLDVTRLFPFYAQAASWEARLVELREEYGDRLPADVADQVARIRELNSALLPEIKRELASAHRQLQAAIPQLTQALEHEARLIEEEEQRLVTTVENFMAAVATETESRPNGASEAQPMP